MPRRARKSTNFLVCKENELTGALNALQNQNATGTDPKTFHWNKDNIWQDEDSWRIAMIIRSSANKMDLKVQATGQWKLTAKVELYVRQHEWVFKLDAFNSVPERLFTIVTPRIVARPANDRLGGEADIVVSGFSPEILTHFGDIDHWLRRGSGEYWD